MQKTQKIEKERKRKKVQTKHIGVPCMPHKPKFISSSYRQLKVHKSRYFKLTKSLPVVCYYLYTENKEAFYSRQYMYNIIMLWFNFVLVLNNHFLCFGGW